MTKLCPHCGVALDVPAWKFCAKESCKRKRDLERHLKNNKNKQHVLHKR